MFIWIFYNLFIFSWNFCNTFLLFLVVRHQVSANLVSRVVRPRSPLLVRLPEQVRRLQNFPDHRRFPDLDTHDPYPELENLSKMKLLIWILMLKIPTTKIVIGTEDYFRYFYRFVRNFHDYNSYLVSLHLSFLCWLFFSVYRCCM